MLSLTVKIIDFMEGDGKKLQLFADEVGRRTEDLFAAARGEAPLWRRMEVVDGAEAGVSDAAAQAVGGASGTAAVEPEQRSGPHDGELSEALPFEFVDMAAAEAEPASFAEPQAGERPLDAAFSPEEYAAPEIAVETAPVAEFAPEGNAEEDTIHAAEDSDAETEAAGMIIMEEFVEEMPGAPYGQESDPESEFESEQEQRFAASWPESDAEIEPEAGQPSVARPLDAVDMGALLSPEPYESPAVSERRNVISLRGVSLYHARGFTSGGHPQRRRGEELVLSGVDFEVGEGEMIYLIGKVGSGKSTLLKMLYAEIPLYEGHGEVVGYDLRKLRRRDIPRLRRKLGVVFQDYQLLTDRNVFNNLHYVMSATGWTDERLMRKRIEDVLGMVGLVNKEYKMPFELSGGEQQRLAIARALINNPRVILADEPTGNLDPGAAEEVMSLFRDIVATGCSIVMSTHNIANIQFYPGRTVRFANGRIEQIDIRSKLGI